MHYAHPTTQCLYGVLLQAFDLLRVRIALDLRGWQVGIARGGSFSARVRRVLPSCVEHGADVFTVTSSLLVWTILLACWAGLHRL